MSEPLPPSPNVEPLSRVQVLTAMGVTAVILLLVSRLWLAFDRVRPLSVDWSWEAMLLGLGLGLGITGASSIAYWLWPSYRQSADYYLAMVIQPLAWADLIWLGLLPGMSEELLFRGVMLPALGLTWFGLLLSSICFGILHYSGSQQWAYIVWATIIGMMLGFSAWATGNLLVPIVAHTATNLISSLSWKWNAQQASP